MHSIALNRMSLFKKWQRCLHVWSCRLNLINYMYSGHDRDVFFLSGRLIKSYFRFVLHIYTVTGPPNAKGKSGHAVLLEVLIHESIDNRIVERIWKTYGLCNSNNHIDCDVIILLVQVTWKQESKAEIWKNTHFETVMCTDILLDTLMILLYSNSMWTVWKGAQQTVNSTTMVTIILMALRFFLLH